MKLILACLLLFSPTLFAAPDEGDLAPAFSMQGSDGITYSNETLAGKPYVIAFFPKVFTGG